MSSTDTTTIHLHKFTNGYFENHADHHLLETRISQNYANFKGRDTRPEFWWFYLANVILSYGLILIGGATTGALNIIGSLYGLAAIIPGIAAGVRRLHDTGKSGGCF